MGMSIGGARVVLVEYRDGAANVEAYANRLTLVLDVINNGGIGGNDASYYGSPAHLAALDTVERQIADTRALIAKYRAND